MDLHSRVGPNMDESTAGPWPDLRFADWKDTCVTLQLWSQIVGKIRLVLTPWLNHSWHVALYVTAKGLTTSPIPYGSRTFEIEFNFRDHTLDISTNDRGETRLALRPQSVADFYGTLMTVLRDLGIQVAITELPCEIGDAILFSRDRVHASYDADYARRFWLALLQADRVLKLFRTGFIGKCSPVHFFWGSFDLAVTRFSGRRAPTFTARAPGVHLRVMQDAYSQEVSSAGFWPGGNGVDASFYSYAYPEPEGYRTAAVQPSEATYSEALREFLLPYEAVRTAADPDATLLEFLRTTFEAAATRGHWDRDALESPMGRPGVCRLIEPA